MNTPENIEDNNLIEDSEYYSNKGYKIIPKKQMNKIQDVLKQALTEVNEAMIDNEGSWEELSNNIYKLLKELKAI